MMAVIQRRKGNAAMATAPIQDVPPGEVGCVVQSFVDNGESRVTAVKQGNGLFTVAPGGAAASRRPKRATAARTKTPRRTKRR
jgi:hypothetical protein